MSPRDRRPLLFVHEASFGGMGLGSQFLIDACARADVATYRLVLTTPQTADADRGRLTQSSVAHALRLYRRALSLLARRRVDIVYLPIAQWGMPLARDLVLVATASAFRVPVVIHLHGSQLAERVSRPTRARDGLTRRVLRSKRWAVLSEPLGELLISSGAAATVHVLRNPAFSAERSEVAAPAHGNFRIGFLGLCCTDKGLDVLVEAVRRTRNDGVGDIELAIAGPIGDVSPPADAWSHYLGRLDREDLGARFWSQVDVLFLPARWHEGLPFVVLEALEARKLVFVTPSLGLAELVDAGAVRPASADVEACVAAISSARRRYSELLRESQAAWARLRPRFDPERLRDEWLIGLGLLHARPAAVTPASAGTPSSSDSTRSA